MTPEFVALLTAFYEQEKDYNWYVKTTNQPELFERLKQIWETFLMDRQGNAPRIIVLSNPNKIGILVGDIVTKRTDFRDRVIADTLYLEFPKQDNANNILFTAAALLSAFDSGFDEYQKLEQLFLDYCENEKNGLLRKYKEHTLGSIPPEISLPPYEQRKIENIQFPSEVAIYSDSIRRKKCADYLRTKSVEKLNSFILVSTGRVDKEDIQKYANTYTGGELIILTLSDTVEGEIDLRNLRDRFSAIPSLFQHARTLIPNPLSPEDELETWAKETEERLNEWGKRTDQHIDEWFSNTGQRIEECLNEWGKRTDQHIDEWFSNKDRWFNITSEQMTEWVATKLKYNKVLIIFPAGLVAVLLYWVLLDRTPPQLASLTLQSSNLMQAAQTPLPRFGNFGNAQLTFSDSVQGVKLSNQACEKADDTAKTWECAVAFSSDNPNQAETLTLVIADVKDDAGNVMQAATFTMQIESADIRAELLDASRTILKDGAAFAVIQVKASAKYGVKAVTMLGVPAAQTQAPEVWQAEIPLASAPKMPLTAVIRDAHDNELQIRLF